MAFINHVNFWHFKMAKPGRKPIEIDLKQVEALAGSGLTEAQIAEALGIGYRTLETRKHDYSEFSQAIKKGKAKGIAHVTNKLMEQVNEGNTTAILFYLKCRADWKETAVHEFGDKPLKLILGGKNIDPKQFGW
jgi:transposase